MSSAWQKSESSGGDGIDLKKRQRSPLSPNFYLSRTKSRNLETTAIGRTIRNRSGYFA
ncbi:hypothetical protein [Paenibacillus sp.]|uniref:hypothetical protein n=1 Tax=Paenibacillus sp. TaxID=58172 RepID=UPI00282C873A|nr:hypothetical protein [Paenibacillus sp.]MDR0270196.1 hypothetical protein [Paenibacillus sp.]